MLRAITTLPSMRETSVIRSSVMPSAKYSCCGSLLRLANGRTTIDSRGAEKVCTVGIVGGALVFSHHAPPAAISASAAPARAPKVNLCRRRPRDTAPGCARQVLEHKSADRLGDVLDVLITQGRKGDRQTGADLIAHRPRQADPAGFGQRLEPGGDVDAVAVKVGSFDDDVADMDADAEPHLFFGRAVGVLAGERLLHRDRAFDGIGGAGKIGDDAIACGVEDAAVVDRNELVEDRPVGLQPTQRADLVDAHQPAVFGDIGGKDGGELSFDRRAVYHVILKKPAPRANLGDSIAFFARQRLSSRYESR